MKAALLKMLAPLLLIAFDSGHAEDARPSGQPEAGETVFKKCMACHQVGPNARNSIGPVLNGVVGRPAGRYPGYNYSLANKNSGLVWDEPTLSRYLRAPAEVVPGTKMIFFGLKKDQETSDVIACLKQFADKQVSRRSNWHWAISGSDLALATRDYAGGCPCANNQKLFVRLSEFLQTQTIFRRPSVNS